MEGPFSRRSIQKQDFLIQARKNYYKYFSEWDEFEQIVEYGKLFSYTEARLISEYPVDVLRSDLINYLIAEYGFRQYLEIGVDRGANFSRIRCPFKHCIDPQSDYPATHPVTSDVFFESLNNDVQYDLVFIEGLHTCEQVIRDVENALNHLAEGGFILMHNCNPDQEEHQTKQRTSLTRTSDVWKAWMYFRQTRADLTMAVVDADCGVGVIRWGEQNCYLVNKNDQHNFSLLNQNRQSMLNLISVDEFKRNYQGNSLQAVQQGVSFCIATNGMRAQKTLLEILSIKKTMKKASLPYEIIICGDVKNFETVDDVQLVKAPADAQQGLLAKLKNSAAEKARFEVIVFADDDLLFDTNWGEQLLKFSARQNWDILGNRVLLPNGGRYWDRCTYDPHELVDYDAKKITGILYQSGAFMLIKMRVYEQEKWDSKIELYAERNGGINEDVEYSLRLQEEGYVLSFDKDNLVWHNDDSYVEDVQKQRVLKLETAEIENLPIPPVKVRFNELQSALLELD